MNGSGATFGGAQTLTVVTNAAGQATAAGLTPTAAGAINISATATLQGQTATVAIAQANVVTAAEAARLAKAGGGASGGGMFAGKFIAIVGGIGAASAGVAVAASGSSSDSPTSTTTTTTQSPTGGTPTTPTTPTQPPNSAPVINAATVTPNVGLVAVTPIAFDVQATDPDNMNSEERAAFDLRK